jgi:hypothetical protein
VALELVGVTAGDLPSGTRRLVPDKPNYAGFVRWLRRHRRRWHAAVAPLADSPFNAAKSDLKLLEYAALGLRTVASAVGPYADAPAVLARPATSLSVWVDALGTAGVEAAAHEQARHWVMQHRTMTPESIRSWESLLTSRE